MQQGTLSVFLSLVFSITCISCLPQERPPLQGIYILRDGDFLKTRGINFEQNTTPRPWAVQTRITDMYSGGDKLFCLVNNYGIAALSLEATGPHADPAAPPLFSYYYAPSLFGTRSSGGFYPLGNSLFCHVYRDDFFSSDVSGPRPPPYPAGSVTFIRLPISGPGPGPAGIIAPDPQRRDPAWQAVVINPLYGNTVAIEWKLKTTDRVRFHYTSYNLASGEEAEHSREWFMNTFTFGNALGGGTPSWYTALFRACISEITLSGGEYLLHFAVTDARSHVSQRYAYQTGGYKRSDDSRYLSVEVSRDETPQGALLAALLPKGRVLLLAEDSREVRPLKLPALPAHCRYTDLILFRGYICAAWEEISFTRVGAAGLAVVSLGDGF